MTEIKTEFITLNVADGTSMRAFVAAPEGGGAKLPGMLVFQEAFGVNGHIRDVTQRIGRLGYVAIAPELFHRTAPPGFEGSYDNFPAVMPHVAALKDEGLEADIRAAHEALQSRRGIDRERIACIGFCMGGRVSFLADLILPLRAAISFYGGGIAPGPRGAGLLGRAKELHAPILMFWGGLDKHIGPEQHRTVADALRAAGKKYANVEFSDADHAFFCDARASYNAAAAEQAWALSQAFLKSELE
ncbi:MAG TPA: dienelactone hydrolase family protein [Candidatus Limnocylindrales bacterium]|nr:dienelactone hydrolase family protein [Candidatus Limnocylindrales bacterium]